MHSQVLVNSRSHIDTKRGKWKLALSPLRSDVTSFDATIFQLPIPGRSTRPRKLMASWVS